MIRSTLLIAPVLISTFAMGDTVSMKSYARVDPAGIVLLRDIASLEGEHAVALGDITVGRITEGELTLKVSDVRTALDEHGAHWGFISLNGRACTVTAAPSPKRSLLGANEPTAVGRAASRTSHHPSNAAELAEGNDLRAFIIRHLQRELAVDLDRLQVRFDVDDRSELALDGSVYAFDIKTTGSLRSKRVVLTIRTWEGSRYVGESRVVTQPLVRQKVAVVCSDLRRDDVLQDDDFKVEERWLEPSGNRAPHDPDTVIDQIARRTLRTGDIIKTNDIAPERLVRRGQTIEVLCRVGGVSFKIDARSEADGALGDRIEVRKIGERATFHATVTAPGIAVVDASETEVGT